MNTRRKRATAIVPFATLWLLAGTGAFGVPQAERSELIDAVKAQDLEAVDRLLAAEPGALNRPGADGSTALHWAAEVNNVPIFDRLIDAGADLTAATRHNVTPLELAATNGNAAMIERLLDAGVDANAVSEVGQTALMTAALNGSTDAIQVLLDRGADANAREPYRGQTALMWAAGEGNAETAAVLIDAGADVQAASRGGFTALLFAARNNRVEAARALLERGANANDTAPDGTSALNVAMINAHYDIASLLLDHGADPNAPDARASSLHILAWLRKPGSTFDAAARGIDPETAPRPTGGVTPLELARKLLDHGADPNARVAWQESRFSKAGGTTRNPPGLPLGRHYLSYVGATPFYVAARNGDAALMRLLAEGGADPLVGTESGVTPLMAAAGLDYYEGETPGPRTGVPESERLEAVRLALALGNDIQARTDFGDYPMTGDTTEMLFTYPDNFDDLSELGVGDPRFNGMTALHGAVISNQPSIVRFLLARGADARATNQLGWTPLMVAEGLYLANAGKDFPAAEAILREAIEATPERSPQ